ncbi:MAG: HpcH/HpaI aldolase/citrate lyase family protein [Candidatus Competibacterales bacterium]
MNLRLRRSVLYLPGSNARALEKARGLAADGLIFDLEDAVAPEAKARARQQVVQALGAGGYGQRERIIRVNGLDTPWGNDDVAAVASTDADAVLFPKVENADQVADAVAALGKAGAPEAMALWLMIETPRGVLDVDSIAGSHRRLDCLVMGTSDLAKETRIPHTPDRRGLVAALSHCVYAARAWGLGILDGVHLALDDAEG